MSHILAIDLGGTKIFAALFDEFGNIVGRAKAKTRAQRGSEAVFKRIVKTAKEAIQAAAVSPDQIAAIGIGAPGPLDPDSGYIIEAANLQMRQFPLGPRLQERFQCPVILDNDVNAGTYGEFRMGAARGASDVLGVFVGTGIGGGIIIDGKLHRGFSKNAGEVGHMVIKAGGPRCNCGRRGCLEALASRTAISRDIRKAIKRGKKTLLTRMLGKKIEDVPSKALRKAYLAGDELVIRHLRRAAKYIGIGIGGLINVLGPQVVVLGGGVVEALGDEFVGMIEKVARRYAFESAASGVKITRASLGDDAGLVGAALLARERMQMAV